MIHKLRTLAACLAMVGLVVAGSALADPQSKSKGRQRAKEHKHFSGKDLIGDKIKVNGHHNLEQHGKFSSSVDVSDGKIAGIKVTHPDKGDVPVTKYKSTRQMAETRPNGLQFASVDYARDVYVSTLWIGYAFIDDFGFEIIYWFPVSMILDGDAGAVEYYPAY